MREDEVKDLVKAYVAAVNRKDVEGVVSLFAPESRLQTPLGSFQGQESIRQFYASLFGAYESYVLTPQRLSAYGDEASLQWEARGTMGGKAVSLRGSSYFRLHRSTFLELKVYYDQADLERQLSL